jgi:Na+/melibiose symporter-like transporter
MRALDTSIVEPSTKAKLKLQTLGVMSMAPLLDLHLYTPCIFISQTVRQNSFAYYYDLVTCLEDKTCFPLFWQRLKKSLKYHNFIKITTYAFLWCQTRGMSFVLHNSRCQVPCGSRKKLPHTSLLNSVVIFSGPSGSLMPAL